MKLAHYLHCADITRERFKVLNQRDQLPHVAGSSFPHSPLGEENVGKFANYSLSDAFAMRLMLDLIGGEGPKGEELVGIVPSYACKVVSNACMPHRNPSVSFDNKNVWAGVAVFQGRALNDQPLRYTRWFLGDVSELPRWIAATSIREHDDLPIRVLIANASRAAAFVRARAEDLGLPEAGDAL
jgi:hypothetical protein